MAKIRKGNVWDYTILVINMSDISIIVPLYNGNKYVDKILKVVSRNVSLLLKTIEVELLFINDCTEPIEMSNTTVVLPNNLKVKLFENERNIGIHASRVKGFNVSCGDYLLFLDQDDKICDNYLSSQLSSIKNADVSVCNGIRGHKLIYSDKTAQERLLKIDSWQAGLNVIISPGQALIRKSAIPNIWIDNIMEDNGADDLFLWVSLHNANARFEINENILFEHKWHGDNASSNISKMKKSLIELSEIADRLELVPQAREAIRCAFYKHVETVSNPLIMNIAILKKWLYFSERGIGVQELLLSKNYKNIAVYGMGTLGECLYNSLSHTSEVKIVYGIDRRAECFRYEFPIYLPGDDIPETDVIIVTIPKDYKEIEYNLRQKGTYNIISIEDIFV